MRIICEVNNLVKNLSIIVNIHILYIYFVYNTCTVLVLALWQLSGSNLERVHESQSLEHGRWDPAPPTEGCCDDFVPALPCRTPAHWQVYCTRQMNNCDARFMRLWQLIDTTSISSLDLSACVVFWKSNCRVFEFYIPYRW